MPILPIIASAIASAFLGKVISNAMDNKEPTTASKDKFQLNVDQCASSSNASKADGVGKDDVGSQGALRADDESADKIKKSKSTAGAPALAAALDSQITQSRVNQASDEAIGIKPSTSAGGLSSFASTPAAIPGTTAGTTAPAKTSASTSHPPFKPAAVNQAGAASSDEWPLVSQNMQPTGVFPDNSLADATQVMAVYGVDVARPSSSNAVSVTA
ncbi:MAG: hypothetical protein VB032_08650 [Burkholderiaceae bacterium]|nr:hypothetical protein [Burkholderiaceae bacterium]